MKKSINSTYFFTLLIIFLSFNLVITQNLYSKKPNRTIEFPDIPGYQTLVCDFHQHTIFSDGEVWPSIRVKEAQKDGLDAISITDHLEYQPHMKDVPHTDRNRSYQIAQKEADGKDVIIINGAEITRDMPPGHLNAIFLEDGNKLLQDDVLDVCREAKKQGAFIFWNHPNWIAQCPSAVAELTDMHRQLLKEGLINGIEIVNETTYSKEAFQMAIDYNLTILGNSDIHGLIDWNYNQRGDHRPATLIFAKEKSKVSIKEGLNHGRTAVWFKNTLIGKSDYLTPLIQESLILKKVEVLKSYKGNSLVQSVFIKNQSDADYILENKSDFAFYSDTDVITIKAHTVRNIQVKTLEILTNFDLRFNVLNAFVAPDKHPEIILIIENKEKK